MHEVFRRQLDPLCNSLGENLIKIDRYSIKEAEVDQVPQVHREIIYDDLQHQHEGDPLAAGMALAVLWRVLWWRVLRQAGLMPALRPQINNSKT